MAKFIVKTKEQWVGEVTVEAKNRDEAIERAKEASFQPDMEIEFSNFVASETWEVKKTR